jgi:hypothetical protein
MTSRSQTTAAVVSWWTARAAARSVNSDVAHCHRTTASTRSIRSSSRPQRHTELEQREPLAGEDRGRRRLAWIARRLAARRAVRSGRGVDPVQRTARGAAEEVRHVEPAELGALFSRQLAA